MNNVGIHVRMTGTLSELIEKALRLELPFFQFFLLSQETGKLIRITEDDKQQFLELRRAHYGPLFVHGSYWINLAGVYNDAGAYMLSRELALAKQLECTHIIVHPGSAKGAKDKQEGIDALVHTINRVLKRDRSMTIVLENSAHGGMTIGGDITDFSTIRQKLDYPENVAFCIDTAHAYAYGYPLGTANERESFIQLLETTIGLSTIVLLHLNDVYGSCGARIDRHAIPGQGSIGIDALRALVSDSRLKNMPVLMELPVMTEAEEKVLIDMVRMWYQ